MKTDAVVVGGGLAGLAVAAYLARAGREVVLLEKAEAVGGRARTQARDGFFFNVGPHALFRGGAGVSVLRDLGVPFHGRVPAGTGAFAVRDGRRHTLPTGLLSLLTTGLLGSAAKIEFARFFDSLRRLDPASVRGLTVSSWLDREGLRPGPRGLVEALVRVSTYAADASRQSAEAALRQVQVGLAGGVLYLDGGWQTLVDGLRASAEGAGARIVRRSAVARIECADATCHVLTADGMVRRARTVVVATSPRAAASLLDHAALGRFAASAAPVRAATLDVGLESLPRARATFALGIGEPLYCSVHSAAAALSPVGGAMVHVLRYLGGGADPADARVEAQLEGLLDLMQPGWRERVVHRRFVPDLVVSNALVTESGGGLAGRPDPAVAGMPGMFVAGDWVGGEGMLADAALASARRAAALALAAELRPRPRQREMIPA